MKKIALFIMVIVCFGGSVLAQSKTLSSSQLALRNSIQSYLKAEGFQPMIDDDGDIKFKRQGDTYFVRVSATDENPMFVKLSKYFNYNDAITRTKLLLFNGDNDYKMCKIFPANEFYIIKSEMYLTTSSSFTNIFYKILQVMDGVEEEIRKM
ncbi:MAG: hypothetical protein IJ634_08605 [Bacteroidales bacterium]|nr:hypothetical protein [Bacteroidales bacterium]